MHMHIRTYVFGRVVSPNIDWSSSKLFPNSPVKTLGIRESKAHTINLVSEILLTFMYIEWVVFDLWTKGIICHRPVLICRCYGATQKVRTHIVDEICKCICILRMNASNQSTSTVRNSHAGGAHLDTAEIWRRELLRSLSPDHPHWSRVRAIRQIRCAAHRRSHMQSSGHIV